MNAAIRDRADFGDEMRAAMVISAMNLVILHFGDVVHAAVRRQWQRREGVPLYGHSVQVELVWELPVLVFVVEVHPC